MKPWTKDPGRRAPRIVVGAPGIIAALVASTLLLAIPADPRAVPALVVAGLPLVLVWRFGPRNEFARAALLVACGAIWLTFLARIPLLLAVPEFFRYPLYGPIDSGDLRRAAYGIGVEAAFFLAPFLLALPRSAPNDPEPSEGFLTRHLTAVATVFLALIVFRAGLLGAGVGFLGLASGRLGALVQLVPEILMVGVAVFFVVTRKPGSGPTWWFFAFMLLALSSMTLLRGSKASLLRIIFAASVLWLFWSTRVRVRVSRGVAQLLVVGVLVWISFGAGLWVRTQVAGIQSGAGQFLARDQRVSVVEQLRFGANEISGRFLGLDGRLLAGQTGVDRLDEALTLPSAVRGAASQLLPGVDQPSVPMGKAISVYASGHRWDFPNEGGVGLFASAHFLGGGLYWMVLMAVGFAFGLVFRMVAKIEDRDARTVVAVVVSYSLVGTVMSGNLDRQLAFLCITLVQVVVYAVVVRFASRALGRA